MLTTLVILLCGATIAVPLTRRAGFGSVLGYLLAGIAIGPAGLRLITNVDAITSISGLGVVMLLFLIGLEVRPQRLWVMRRAVFGLGTAQVAITAAAIAGAAHAAGVPWRGAVALGAGLAIAQPSGAIDAAQDTTGSAEVLRTVGTALLQGWCGQAQATGSRVKT